MKRKNPPKQQRNAACRCGSGKKYKKCCLIVERGQAIASRKEFEERLKKKAEEFRKKMLDKKEEIMREYDLSASQQFVSIKSGVRSPAIAAIIAAALIGGMENPRTK